MKAPSAPPRLIIITDTARAPKTEWLRRLAALLPLAAAGSVMVQLRDRQLPVRERLHFGNVLSALCVHSGQLFCVSERLDLALLLEAHAVHLPGDAVAPEDARALSRAHGRSWFISVACHEPEQVSATSADAVLLSPMMAERKGKPPLGRAGLARALRVRSAPGARAPALYALGGVTEANARALLDAGADGVALIGELLAIPSPARLLDALRIAR